MAKEQEPTESPHHGKRKGQHHREGMDEALKLSGENHVNDQNSEPHGKTKLIVALLHGLGLSRHGETHTYGQNFRSNPLGVLDGFGEFDPLEVGADIDAALAIDPRDFRRSGAHLDGHQISQRHGLSAPIAYVECPDRIGIRPVFSVHPHTNIVPATVFLERSHVHSAHHHLDRLGNGPSIDPHGGSFLTVWHHLEFRETEFQALVEIDEARYRRKRGDELIRDPVEFLERKISAQIHVETAAPAHHGLAGIENPDLPPGNRTQFLPRRPDHVHHTPGALFVAGEGAEDHRTIAPAGGVVTASGARGREDANDLGLSEKPGLVLFHVLQRSLQRSSGQRLGVAEENSLVRRRKEFPLELRSEDNSQTQRGQGCCGRQGTMAETQIQRATVAIFQPPEAALEPRIDTLCAARFWGGHARGKHRGHCQRDEKRDHHAPGDHQPKLAQEAAHQPLYEKHGDEDCRHRNRRGRGRKGDLPGAGLCGSLGIFTLLPVSLDILEHHDGIVDDHAHRQGHSQQRHGV